MAEQTLAIYTKCQRSAPLGGPAAVEAG
jgi:hypothetical protein